MKKDLVILLQSKSVDIAKNFSNTDRVCNGNKELFSVDKIIPLSESVAIIIFNKLPTNKKALAVTLYINGGEGYWQYFFPTDSHILGLKNIDTYLHDIEVFNFNKN